METRTHDDEGRPLIIRLERDRSIDPHTECWIWTGARTKAGYGELRIARQVKYVHRVAATIYLGLDESSGHYVLHRCDIRECFNPAHLFIGTQADNMRDAAMKGRLGRGKLNADKVREIRALLASGWTHKEIAQRYGVSPATISQIARRQTWKHVTDHSGDSAA